MEIITEYGYLGLFLASFLAATILPLSSEVVLGYLLTHDFNIYLTVCTATSGNVMGAVVNYGIGIFGSQILLQKVLRISNHDMLSAEIRFKKYGVLSLLFAWVPVIGDPLTVAAGVLKTNFYIFFILVGLGKFLRYVFLAAAVGLI